MSSPPPFNPVTDIYANSDYARQVAGRYMGYEPPTYGFNPQDASSNFARNYGRGYYRYEDNRSMTEMIAATVTAMLTDRTAMPGNRRSLAHNLDVYENSRAYSRARIEMLQQRVLDRMLERGRNVAPQRSYHFSTARQEQLRNMIESPVTGMALWTAQAVAPELFERGFGRAGSGLGIFDATWASSTYRVRDDGMRWSVQDRQQYATRAMSSLYLDPAERARRRFDSLQGGHLWTNLEAMGLLGGNDAEWTDMSHDEIRKAATTFFGENNISPHLGDRTRRQHEQVQKVMAVNTKRGNIKSLQAQLAGVVTPEQKTAIADELRKEVGELGTLEESAGLKPQGIRLIADLGKAESAMRTLQAHSLKRPLLYGQEQHDAETQRLAKEARDALLDAGLVSASGKPIDLAGFQSHEELQNLTSSLERANTLRQEHQKLSRQVDDVVSVNALQTMLDKYIQGKGVTSLEQRRASLAGSGDMPSMERAVAAIIQAEKSKDTTAVESARQTAIKIAGGDVQAALLVRSEERRQRGISSDLDLIDTADRELVRGVVRAERVAARDTAQRDIDMELARSGLQQDTGKLDLSELPLDEIVKISDAILGMSEDPRLAQWMKNSAMINSKKHRFAEYEYAIRALQESMTDQNASPDKLFRTLVDFAGGNLHQMDTTQLRHSVRQTYALARQMGQGDEYVAATLSQSQNMLASLGVNRAFSGWHGMQSLMHQAAATANPNYYGIWGSQTMQEVADNQNKRLAAWLASDSANQFGAALRLQETYGRFQEGTNASNYVKALSEGKTTFEENFRTPDGNLAVRQRSVRMSENEFRALMAESIGSGNADLQRDVMDTLTPVLKDRSANQHALHKNQQTLDDVARAQQSASFVTSSARAMAHSLIHRGSIGTGLQAALEGSGVTESQRDEVITGLSLKTMDRMLDSQEQERIAKKHGIDRNDTNFHAKVAMALLGEQTDTLLQNKNLNQEQRQVVEAFQKQLSDPSARDSGVFMRIGSVFSQVAGRYNMTDTQAFQEFDVNLARKSKLHGVSARAEAREQEAYSEGISDSMMAALADAWGDGASLSDMVTAAMRVYNLKDDAPLMVAHRAFQQANDRLTRLEAERERIRGLPDSAEKTKLLQENERQLKIANENLTYTHNELQPHLTIMRTQAEHKYSSKEWEHKIGVDYDLMHQYATVQDKDGKFRLQLLQRDQVRQDADGSGRLQIKNEKGDWEDKRDAVYLGQFSTKDAEGNEIFQYRKLTWSNKQWKYQDEQGQVQVFDQNQDNQKLVTGNRIKTIKHTSADGSYVEYDDNAPFLWSSDNYLMRADDDGTTTTVIGSDGTPIHVSSDFGQKVMSGQVTTQELAGMQSGQFVSKDQITTAKQKNEEVFKNPKDEFEKKLLHEANKDLRASGHITQINLTEIQKTGDDGTDYSFYMIRGANDDQKVEEADARYRAFYAEEQRNLEAFFNTKDEDTAKTYTELWADEDTKKAWQTWQFTEVAERILEEDMSTITASRDRYAKGSEEWQMRDQLLREKEQERIGSRIVRETIKTRLATERAQLRQVRDEAAPIREIADSAANIQVSDPAILDAITALGDKDYIDKTEFTLDEARHIANKLQAKGSWTAGILTDDIKNAEKGVTQRVAQAIGEENTVADSGRPPIVLRQSPEAEAGDAGVKNLATWDVEGDTADTQSSDSYVWGATKKTAAALAYVNIGGRAADYVLDKTFGPLEEQKNWKGLRRAASWGLNFTGNVSRLLNGNMDETAKPNDLVAARPEVQEIPAFGDRMAKQSMQDCTLQAATVHLKVDSMQVTNGNLSITGEGKGGFGHNGLPTA